MLALNLHSVKRSIYPILITLIFFYINGI